MADATILGYVEETVAHWGREPRYLLQILIRIQQRYNHIPSEAVDYLAAELSSTRAHIEGVIGFYSFLHDSPRGEYDLLFSNSITDWMQGSRELMEELARRLKMEPGTTRADRRVSLDYTSCTGMCDQGPAALVNGRALTKLTSKRIKQIAKLVNNKIPLDEWPEDFFKVRKKIRRKDILLENGLPQGAAVHRALELGPEATLQELDDSGLRGRGGAGFKTALKWRFCREAPGEDKVVVCNADEGEPGTFKDRLLLQSYAHRVFEGMTLCATAIGASRGFLYLRGEYLYLLEDLEAELRRRRDAGLLGQNILGYEGFSFDIEIHLGAGAYICGEESALIESLEGKRGNPRIRPPFPVTHGFLGLPTVVNNVETFLAAAMIVCHGAPWFRSCGTDESAGSKLLSISGDCKRPGIYEYPYGVRIEDILEECGAEDTRAVQVAGAAGACVPATEFGRRIAFEDLATGGSFIILDESRKLMDMVENFIDFFVHESCGFCTPCRVGTSLLQKRLSKLVNGHATRADIERMHDIGTLMRKASHCGLGQTAANPILSILEKFPASYASRLRSTSFEPAFDLNASLQEAREITGRDDPGAFLEGGGV
jgi:[NiFe] hydrogenase diaphorase moiety large subunit